MLPLQQTLGFEIGGLAEQLLLLAASSCQILSLLAFAARAGIDVVS